MKNRVLLIVIGFLLAFFTADPALAQDSALEQLETLAGRTAGSVTVTPVPSPTCAGCGGKGGHHYAGCPYVGRSGARARRRAVPWGTTAPAGGFTSSEQFAAQAFSSLFGSLMQDLMAPPPQVDTSYQQQLRKQQQEAEAAKIKQKELERQKSLRQWREFQDKETSERAMEKAEKEKRSRELLATMQTLGSDEPLRMESMAGGKLEAFKLGRPEIVDLSDKKVDEIEESQFFYDLQMRKTGPTDGVRDPGYMTLDEIQRQKIKEQGIPLTIREGEYVPMEVSGQAEIKAEKGFIDDFLEDEYKKAGEKGTQWLADKIGIGDAYSNVKEAGGIYEGFVVGKLMGSVQKAINCGANGDSAGYDNAYQGMVGQTDQFNQATGDTTVGRFKSAIKGVLGIK